jgi:hypothetical protein
VLRTDERGREERESEEWFGFEIVDGGQTSFGLRYTLILFFKINYSLLVTSLFNMGLLCSL